MKRNSIIQSSQVLPSVEVWVKLRLTNIRQHDKMLKPFNQYPNLQTPTVIRLFSVPCYSLFNCRSVHCLFCALHTSGHLPVTSVTDTDYTTQVQSADITYKIQRLRPWAQWTFFYPNILQLYKSSVYILKFLQEILVQMCHSTSGSNMHFFQKH